MIDVILMYFMLFISLTLFYFALKNLKKIQTKAKNNPSETSKYGSNLITGIVAGVMVIVFDRISLSIVNAGKLFIFTSLEELVFSLTSSTIMLFFNISLMLLLVFFIVNWGMNYISK